jgi:allantoinase
MSTENATSGRDFAGYGEKPPHAGWPNGSKIAVNIVINVEEGSEPSVREGAANTETSLIETGGSAFPGRDLAAESMFEYGSRAGFWRLLRILKRYRTPATFFATAVALERNPAIAAAIREGVQAKTWDVCCHGLRWVRHQELDLDAERRAIAEAHRSITASTGAPPEGWYCRYAPTVNTRRIIVEHGGFLYDSDAYNDDLPYWVTCGGRPHLVVPYSQATNDGKFVRGSIATAGDFYEVLMDQFEVLLAEGEEAPKMMSVGLHCRLAGHPFRSVALSRFLDRIVGRPDVWICRRNDLARHWSERFPAPAPVGAV